jgi:hypothetical protein
MFSFLQPFLPFVYVGQRLQGDDVFVIQPEHVSKRSLGRREIAEVLVTPAEHDACRDVVRVQLQTNPQQFEGTSQVAILTVDLGQRREREPVRILGVPALQFIDFARGHRIPGSRSEMP